jgi:hypothetical protein
MGVLLCLSKCVSTLQVPPPWWGCLCVCVGGQQQQHSGRVVVRLAAAAVCGPTVEVFVPARSLQQQRLRLRPCWVSSCWLGVLRVLRVCKGLVIIWQAARMASLGRCQHMEGWGPLIAASSR